MKTGKHTLARGLALTLAVFAALFCGAVAAVQQIGASSESAEEFAQNLGRAHFRQIKKQNTIVLFGGTSNGNRTHDFALRGQRLDRLTMEANGWGTRIRT